jgi:ABC-type uncharacterized transport system involved in gliding motility auxiliary subunit
LPNPPKDFEQKAQEAGMMPLQFEEVGSDQLAIRRGFMGLQLYYRDKSETIPVIKDVRQLEYDITTKIARMASRTKKTIAVTTGHGESEWLGPRSRFAEELRPLYELNTLDLAAGTTAPIQADALLVVGPSRPLDARALAAIDEAVTRGIPAAFLVDIKTIMTNQFAASPLDTGLVSLLERYGVKLGSQLVYDAQAETIGITQNMGGFAFTSRVQYPFIPLSTNVNRDAPIMRGIETVALPFVTTVEALAPPKPGVRFTSLFQSSPRSWLAPAQLYNVNPMQIPQPSKDDPHGPFVLGGLVEGEGKTLVVIGTSHVVDPNLPEFRGAGALMSNVLAYLAKDEVLLGIRTRGDILRPLKPLKDPIRQLVKVVSVLGAPLVMAGVGLWRWRRRQAWRTKIAATFNAVTPT